MFLQFLFLAVLVPAGVFLSYWTRRANIQGFEIWLPFSIILSFGISPLVGFVFAMTIIIASWFLFPFELQSVAIMGVCLLATLLSSSFFTVTQSNFLWVAMLLTVSYNIVSNAIFVLLMANWFNALKFFVFSVWLSWLVYSNFGWQLVLWFSA